MPTQRYHIGKNGPMPCNAKIKCPLGDEAPHFNSKDEAQNYYDKEKMKENGVLASDNSGKRLFNTSLGNNHFMQNVEKQFAKKGKAVFEYKNLGVEYEVEEWRYTIKEVEGDPDNVAFLVHHYWATEPYEPDEDDYDGFEDFDAAYDEYNEAMEDYRNGVTTDSEYTSHIVPKNLVAAYFSENNVNFNKPRKSIIVDRGISDISDQLYEQNKTIHEFLENQEELTEKYKKLKNN